MSEFETDPWRDRQRDGDGKGGSGDSRLAWIALGPRPSPPVVLIHGVGLRAESWMAVAARLGDTGRVLAVDIPGHGASAALPVLPDLAAYTDRIAAWMGSQGRPAVVAGHSMGALLALDLAIRHPALVAALMSCNAIYRRPPEAAEAVRARAAALASGVAGDVTAPLARWFPDPAQDGPARAACRRWLEAADPAGYAAAYRVFAGEDGPPDEALARIAVPATYLTGALEPNSTPAMSRAMAALTPGADTVVVAGAHHMTPMTHPDAVAEALLRLIDRAGRASGRRTGRPPV